MGSGRKTPLIEALEARTLLSGFFPHGKDNSIARDSSGAEHLAYYDDLEGKLKYAYRPANGTWGQPIVIDDGGGTPTGAYPSIAVDSNNRPGIAYYDGYWGDLEYAKFDGSTWNRTTVDSSNTVGLYPSLVYNSSNSPIISYYYKNAGDLRVAQYSAGWTITAIDTIPDAGRASSIAIQPSTGRLGIAYETSAGDFKYIRQTSSGWAPAMVVYHNAGGGYTSLAFDTTQGTGQCVPTFTFYDAGATDLRFARASTENPSSTTDWSTVLIAGGVTRSAGMYNNLWYQGNGRARATYYFDASGGFINQIDETDQPGVFSGAVSIFYAGGKASDAIRLTDDNYTYTWVYANEGLYISDLSEGRTWVEATSASVGGRGEQAMTVFTDPADGVSKMWLAGGVNSTHLRDVWSSANGVNWNQVTASAAFGVRSEATLTTFAGAMWIIAGKNNSGPVVNGAGSSVVYDSTNGTNWTAVSNNLPGFYAHQTVVFTDPADGVSKLWILGGKDVNQSALATVYKSADGVNWTTVTSSAAFGGRFGHAAVVHDGKIWVIAGHNGTNALNDVWSSSDGVNWTQVSAAANFPVSYSLTAMVYANRITLVLENEIWYSSTGLSWFQFNDTLPYSGIPGEMSYESRTSQASLVFANKMWIVGGHETGSNNWREDVWYGY